MKGEREEEGVKGGGPPQPRRRRDVEELFPRVSHLQRRKEGDARRGVEVTRLYSVQDFSMIRPSADKLSGRDRGVARPCEFIKGALPLHPLDEMGTRADGATFSAAFIPDPNVSAFQLPKSPSIFLHLTRNLRSSECVTAFIGSQ